MDATQNDADWKKIKEVKENLITYGYTFEVKVDRCLVYRFEEPIFGMQHLNDPNSPNELDGIKAHWEAALGAASAHLRFNPQQTPKLYQGLDF